MLFIRIFAKIEEHIEEHIESENKFFMGLNTPPSGIHCLTKKRSLSYKQMNMATPSSSIKWFGH